MFSDFLRIKPILDPGSTATMERNLTKRFQRVAGSFGRGLKNILKVSALGIGLGLLTKLLNPLTEMEERIKKLLGDSADASDLADRLGTEEGKLRLAQGVASSVGVKPENFKDLATAFAKAVESARIEGKTAGGITSDAATAVKNFAANEDVLQSFIQFLKSLSLEKPEVRAAHERAVF